MPRETRPLTLHASSSSASRRTIVPHSADRTLELARETAQCGQRELLGLCSRGTHLAGGGRKPTLSPGSRPERAAPLRSELQQAPGSNPEPTRVRMDVRRKGCAWRKGPQGSPRRPLTTETFSWKWLGSMLFSAEQLRQYPTSAPGMAVLRSLQLACKPLPCLRPLRETKGAVARPETVRGEWSSGFGRTCMRC